MKFKICSLLFLFLLFNSCQNPISELEKALIFSGENRPELEKVLSHYSEKESDSLKLKAARFLIENMPGHYSWYGTVLEDYRDSLERNLEMQQLSWHMRNIFHNYPYDGAAKLSDVQKIEDIHCITADYLITNIEQAFEVWQNPWARHFGFDDFCDYLLPYRIGNEPLINWRDSLKGIYTDLIQEIINIDEIFDSPYQLCTQVNDRLIGEMQAAKEKEISFSHPLIGHKTVLDIGCPELVHGVIYVMRSMGIPVSIEIIEQWSTRSGRHFWNAVYHFTGLHYPFTGYESRPRGLNQDLKINKVYRKTYRQNRSALPFLQLQEEIPPFLRNIFLWDVTHEYMTTYTVHIPIEPSYIQDAEFAYLCVFNNEKWVPVDWGKIKNGVVTFTNVGPQTVFIAGIYDDQEILPASAPFRILLDGTIRCIEPDNNTISMKLERKYPLFRRFANYSRHFIEATFEGSHQIDFTPGNMLAVIEHDANTQMDSILLNSSDAYRYYRLKSPRKLELSEIEFYDQTGKQIKPARILLPPEGIIPKGTEEKVINGLYADFVEIPLWIGFDLGKSINLSKIRYLPRTDDNHIVRGDRYELSIYRNYRFEPLYTQTADTNLFYFDSIPAGGLYLLKDITKGREHRIFTYENDRVFFW